MLFVSVWIRHPTSNLPCAVLQAGKALGSEITYRKLNKNANKSECVEQRRWCRRRCSFTTWVDLLTNKVGGAGLKSGLWRCRFKLNIHAGWEWPVTKPGIGSRFIFFNAQSQSPIFSLAILTGFDYKSDFKKSMTPWRIIRYMPTTHYRADVL